MKEEDIVSDIEPAASSTVSNDKRSELSNVAKMMALLCSTYTVDVKIWAEKHELCVGHY